MIALLQQYLAINTAHPNPDYAAVMKLFKQQAQMDGFEYNEVVLPSGNPVAIITLRGSDPDLPSVVLNHHMDVVPAQDQEGWIFPPFSGHLDNGIIYGRGTQDCKGLGVAHYGALKRLKESALPIIRTVHLIIVPDEERGGFHGTKEFIDHPACVALNIGYVLDEGMPSGDKSRLLLKVDERTPIQFRVVSSGQQGHASHGEHDNCLHRLINFLHDVAVFNEKEQRSAKSEHADACISMQITSLTADNTALNVIPGYAHATIDMRIPSSVSVQEGIALIDLLMQNHTGLTYEILATSHERSAQLSSRSLLYQSVARAVIECNFEPIPFVFKATTDARFYSHAGIQTLGITPFTSAANLHGTNESISITDLMDGIHVFVALLRILCCPNTQENK